ncbi:AraC family transcriptional regulator [Shimia sp. NS0008-38b]|uniref:helix-turn-helix domain-containing protein n=1 Tax=Shimia sp. NS0008-38b TaxID=3127653 RepID=UPI00334212F9
MTAMYNPKGNSKDRTIGQVQFTETEPPAHLRAVVHRFLELRTTAPLPTDYRFHALPDACTYAIFDQRDPAITGITRLRASSEELSLGQTFHFINIRFLPGVWQGDHSHLSFGLINTPYTGPLPLRDTNAALIGHPHAAQQATLTTFVEHLLDLGLLHPNPVTQAIFAQMEDIHSVADMATAVDYSPRQLQRLLKRTTGFTPHDFLKILRLQQSLLGEPSLSYADQSHFIHAFKKATGYTPGQFSKKFDV